MDNDLIGLLRGLSYLVAGFFAFYLIVAKVLSLLFRSNDKHTVLNAALDAFILPFRWLLIGLLVFFAGQMTLSYFNWSLPFSLRDLKNIFLILIITWFLIRWKNIYISHIKTSGVEAALYRTTFIRGASFFLNLLIGLLALILILDILQIPIAALLTFGGIGGLALSFAAKDLLANLFGTIMIHFNGHISDGDFIRSTSKDFEGHVEKISWFHTRLRSLDKTILYVPNSTLTESIIENEGKRSHRRLVAKVPIDYDDTSKIETITKKIESYLKSHPMVDNKQDCSISLTSYGPYSVELTIYTYLKEINFVRFHQQQQEILLEINNIIQKAGASFGVQTHLHLDPPPSK
jgi:MscS family membrane protein